MFFERGEGEGMYMQFTMHYRRKGSFLRWPSFCSLGVGMAMHYRNRPGFLRWYSVLGFIRSQMSLMIMRLVMEHGFIVIWSAGVWIFLFTGWSVGSSVL